MSEIDRALESDKRFKKVMFCTRHNGFERRYDLGECDRKRNYAGLCLITEVWIGKVKS